MSKKAFDYTKYKQRHIALKILYFGWDYDGLAAQSDNENTIEFHLFQALTKTCLIECRSKCNYNRCGRTDKGVSSFGQVVDLNIRSNLIDEANPENVGLFTPQDYTGPGEDSSKSADREINYVEILNRVLPDHIKVIAWAPAKQDFSSRFNCQSRSYSYIFPLGDLCIKSMQDAAEHLVGEHDFRNLCSFDLKHGVTNHKRTIISAKVKPISSLICSGSSSENQYSFYEIVIVGQAFLYHQIRCIMSILFLVGSRKEKPDIVRSLLDIEKCPARPNYTRASPLSLCLFDCKYDPKDLPQGFYYDRGALCNLLRQLKELWTKYKTKTLMIEQVLFSLESLIATNEGDNKSDATSPKLNCWKDFGLECDTMSDKKYVPLLKRPRDESLETKLITINAKKSNSKST